MTIARRYPVRHVLCPLLGHLVLLLAYAAVDVRADERFVAAIRTGEAPAIDGNLGEAVWARGGASDFTQRAPTFGALPTERTEVMVAFDNEALYIAARMYDREPSAIARRVGQRDADHPSDWFAVSLDPFRDGRSGYFFAVNPVGSIQDGLLRDQAVRDFSWDGEWAHAAVIDSTGWCVEIRIPFSQIRFPSHGGDWWIDCARTIFRKGEHLELALSPTSLPGSAPGFIDLKGVAVGAPTLSLSATPYMLTRAHYFEPVPGNPFATGRNFEADAGVDVRLVVGSDISLTATFNPDFGQVEVDPASINLTAFETTYPEKRSFFVEGAQPFSFGESDGVDLFYSRRIGRAPQGRSPEQVELSHPGNRLVPGEARILGAAKLALRGGERWSLGTLGAVTRREFAEIDSMGIRFFDEIEPLTLFGVIRSQFQTEPGRGGLGVFVTGTYRDLREPRLQSIMTRTALTGGADGSSYLGTGRQWKVSGWIGGSRVAGSSQQMIRLQRSAQRLFQRPDAPHLRVDSAATDLLGWAGHLSLDKLEGNLTAHAGLGIVSPGFEANDIGVLRRSDRIAGDATIAYTVFVADRTFLWKSAGVSIGHELDFSGMKTGESYSLFASAESVEHWSSNASISYQPPALDVSATRGGPAIATAASWSAILSLSTDNRSDLQFWASTNGYTAESGAWSFGIGGGLTWRPNDRILLSAGPWLDRSRWTPTYFDTIPDPMASSTYGVRYVFSTLSQKSISCDIRLDWTIDPTLSLRLYLQPYFSKAVYGSFQELKHPGQAEFIMYGMGASSITQNEGEYRVDPDGDGPARPFSIYNSDFEYGSLRGTAVLRWDYRPGSSLYLAWTQSRYGYQDHWNPGTGGGPDPLSGYPDNVLTLKVTYGLTP